jgi:hypothetical protein
LFKPIYIGKVGQKNFRVIFCIAKGIKVGTVALGLFVEDTQVTERSDQI